MFVRFIFIFFIAVAIIYILLKSLGWHYCSQFYPYTGNACLLSQLLRDYYYNYYGFNQ